MEMSTVKARTCTMEARVTDEEKAALVAVANYYRRRRGEMLRFLVRREAESLGIWDDVTRKARGTS